MAIADPSDRFARVLLGLAVGDALGWPNERCSRVEKRILESPPGGFPLWEMDRVRILPGEYSDDTQLTLAVARSLMSPRWEEHLSTAELPFLLRYQRGAGRATLEAARSWARGVPPWLGVQGYVAAGGNGVVMRIAPHVMVGLVSGDLEGTLSRVFRDGLMTHGHPRALLGALCHAFCLWFLGVQGGGHEDLRSALVDQAGTWGRLREEDLPPGWFPPGWDPGRYRLEWESVLDAMLVQVERMSLRWGPMEGLGELGGVGPRAGTGDATALSALFLLGLHWDSPLEGLLLASRLRDGDPDTLASVLGALLGMRHRTGWIPEGLRGVQDQECLLRTAAALGSGDPVGAARELMESSGEGQWRPSPIGEIRSLGTRDGLEKVQTRLGQTLYLVVV
ncbi:ADP-ribosylglycohydrolase family protein [Thermanaerovibrio acidaminovorans]|uniref:ADP-ribosylglycohydrolase family protein n=1 Tax=Thermanaerovibrio acidaminovorans TaxID=81462 RepID=UPI0024900A5B|nr:ADP-ribosylglycohydrolase family protein [Thermanaerovibrio acidaminovorans]